MFRSHVATEVVIDLSVMGGEPVIRGIRIPVETIIAYLRDSYDTDVIFQIIQVFRSMASRRPSNGRNGRWVLIGRHIGTPIDRS